MIAKARRGRTPSAFLIQAIRVHLLVCEQAPLRACILDRFLPADEHRRGGARRWRVRCLLSTSSYSKTCLRASKLKPSIFVCALSRARVTMRVLDRLVFGDAEAAHQPFERIRRKDAHERVLERDEKLRLARVALAAGAAAQLVVDAARLVALGAEQRKVRRRSLLLRTASGVAGIAAEFDVDAAAGHVGGDGHRPFFARLRRLSRLRARGFWR